MSKNNHNHNQSRNRLQKPAKVWQLASDDVSRSPDRFIKDPADVAFVAPYTFAVADSVGHGIFIYDISRNMLSVVGSGEVWPNGVALTRDSKLRVTDRRTKTIKTYDVRGDLLSVWDLGEDVLSQPHGIAVTSRGETVITDTGNNGIYIFTGDGKLRKQFGSKGDLLQYLRLPFFCAVDRHDNIVISDNMNYCVKIFDTDGNFQRRIGSGNAFGQRQFQCPYGICVDPFNDDILVADYDSHRIFTFNSSDGKFIRYALTASDCQNPCGIALGPCGTIVVTESNPEYANVKAFSLYESIDSNHNIENVWTLRTESAV